MHSKQTFQQEDLRRTYGKMVLSRGRSDPSCRIHPAAPALWTQPDISLPHRKDQFGHCQACVAPLEPLMSLDPEDKPEAG